MGTLKVGDTVRWHEDSAMIGEVVSAKDSELLNDDGSVGEVLRVYRVLWSTPANWEGCTTHGTEGKFIPV